MYFDTHAHYDDKAFDDDRDILLASMPESNISHIINLGCDKVTSEKSVELSARFPFVYAAVGWQPQEWQSWSDNSIEEIRELAQKPKVVAIGEIGLDYYWDTSQKDLQKEMFRSQLKLAKELNLPVVVHDREAHADCLEICDEVNMTRGVFHCYSGSAEFAKLLIDRGWYLGFDGPVTYKNAKKLPEVVKVCPLDRILIETDSPYLSPEPLRGRRNDSKNLPYIAAKIGEIKGLSAEEVAKITKENALRLFDRIK